MSGEIFMIAGEASGDALGAGLMNALKARRSEIVIDGIGGPMMHGQGLRSRMNMQDLCVMGLWEVLHHLPRLMRLIDEVVRMIEACQPAALVTIDLPDFNFRVARKLRARGIFLGKIIHYVSPSVWAWRPGRARKIAQFLDGLICLFPFEPECYGGLGLRTVFAGHPAAQKFSAQRLRDRNVLALFLGSRRREVEGTGKIILQAAQMLNMRRPDIKFVVPTLPYLKQQVTAMLQEIALEAAVVDTPQEKEDIFYTCGAALAVSGTVGLELACAEVPHAIAYTMSSASWFLAQHLVKAKYAHLANILMDAPVVPEYLQGQCTAPALCDIAGRLLTDEEMRATLMQNLSVLRSLLLPQAQAEPSSVAADFVLDVMFTSVRAGPSERRAA